jgi:hypothetical protein
MRSQAHGPAAPGRTTSAPVPGRVVPGRGEPALRLRRTLGNQAVARLRAPDDLDRAVRRGLSSPGEPLDLATRALMEPRLRLDLGGVRVHHGRAAASSAAAVRALAYTVGRDIVLGAGQSRPGTDEGRALLAHELHHVAQQRNVSAAQGAPIRLGGVADEAERRADVLDTEPTLRRAVAPVRTWAGTFTADPYDAYLLKEAAGTVGYGADITVTFEPNKLVDAERISFVQTALSVKDGKPHNKYDANEKERKTAESRSTPGGVHIDQRPHSTTPLYAPSKDGRHHRDATGALRSEPASMTDSPNLNTGDIYVAAADVQTGEWSQRFETTALATAGTQEGMYYGSVRWGWTKGVSDANPRLLKFEAASQNVPSPTFMAAARLWNATPTSTGAKADEVPIADVRKVDAKVTKLWSGPGGTGQATALARGAVLQQTDLQSRSMVPSLSWFWTRVTVLGGRHAGKTGWVWETDLSPRKP